MLDVCNAGDPATAHGTTPAADGAIVAIGHAIRELSDAHDTADAAALDDARVPHGAGRSETMDGIFGHFLALEAKAMATCALTSGDAAVQAAGRGRAASRLDGIVACSESVA